MIKVYRKTATINAEQFDGTKQNADQLGLFKYRGSWYLETLEGSMLVTNGYWIATGVNGEHWAIADDVFKKTYAELPVIPKDVASVIKQAKNRGYRLGWVFHNAYWGIWRVSVSDWIKAHADMFSRAWLDGYVVEDDA